MNVGCPTCGASVEFRYDDSLVRICGSCRSAVLRTDRGIETLGRVADLAPIDSPLRLFAEGRYGEHGFLLVGMAQLRHGAGGVWQEWYAKLDGGRWAWLSEAQGRYYLTFEQPEVPVPPPGALAPGAVVTLAGRAFTVGEVGTGAYASATGEIPYRLDPRATFHYADLADGQGGFATIDYGDGREPPTVYLGHQVELAALRLSGGEAVAAAAAAAPAQGARLPCPSCGGALELRAPDQALRVACPYCNHLVDVSSGQLRVLAKLARRARPAIPLGAKARFAEGEVTVIGYLQRSALADREWYPFEEYLLHAPGLGFRWLVCSDGHWSYVQPVAPGAVEVAPVRYDGVRFELFFRADLRVDAVLGEMYWLVHEGERVIGEDFIAPPAMLSCETSKTEQTWSLSTYLAPAEVRAALAAAGTDPAAITLPAPTGVGANQPYPLRGVGAFGALAFAALCAVGIVTCSGAKEVLRHAETFQLPPGTFDAAVTPPGTPPGASGSAAPAPAPAEAPSNVQFSRAFELDGDHNVQLGVAAQLANQWAYVAVDLVNEQTGALVSFDANLEHYSGVTGGEAWAEGNPRAVQVLGPVAAGRYVVRLEAVHGAKTAIPLALTVRQHVFRARYWLIAALALGLTFGLAALHARGFRRRRWENSQRARSTERGGGSGTAADDDDDDNDWGDDDD